MESHVGVDIDVRVDVIIHIDGNRHAEAGIDVDIGTAAVAGVGNNTITDIRGVIDRHRQ